MAPKRKGARGRGRAKSGSAKKPKAAKTAADADVRAEKLLDEHESYCEELGINIKTGGSAAAFQWLCCSIIFGNRLSEKTTVRAAKGLLKSGLSDPKSVKESDQWTKIEALNSEGNVQRGPSMAERLEETAAAVLEKYEGDLDKLREAAGKDAEKEQQLVKEFKGFGDTAVSIFFREVQLAWEELFPYADERTLEMASKQGLPSGSAQELLDLVGGDRSKFVRLLAAVVKAELRGGKKGKTTPGEAAAKAEGADTEARGKEVAAADEATKATGASADAKCEAVDDGKEEDGTAE